MASFKVGSLFIRTLAKPIANYIKHNAREHERFRQLCVSFAQNLHRIDMRLRLGLLQDPAAIERQVQRELAELNARRSRAISVSPVSSKPTVKTEAQSKLDDERVKREKERLEEKARKLPKVRPLSEAKAIETGANFISEGFLFCVAGGLIGLEYYRSKRKENSRRDDVAERLEELESENSELKAQVIRIESVLEGEGVKLAPTSEWLMLAKKNLKVDKKPSQEKDETTKTKEKLSQDARTSNPQETTSPTKAESPQLKDTSKPS